MAVMECHLALNKTLPAFPRGGTFYIKLPDLAISLLSLTPSLQGQGNGFLHRTPPQ